VTKKIGIISIVFCMLIIGYPAKAQDRLRELDSYFDQWNKTGRLNGSVLVAEKGSVIYKKGFGFANFEWLVPNTPDTKFKLASITKQFTAVMVFQLVQEGMIELDGKLIEYLPLYRKDTGDRVTIDHLLKHMSGIPCYIRNNLMPPSPEPRSKEEIIRDYLSGDLEFEPGSKYKYSNSGYFLLGAIIEKVTSKSYQENLKERILEPLEISKTQLKITKNPWNSTQKTRIQ
jgi:CubicO group peptidase (beta-lactamase class C family)